MNTPLPEHELADDRAAGRSVSPHVAPPGLETGRYGTADVAASGVDLSQLRRNLGLTPAERVERMVAFVRLILPLQGALRRRR